jgi:glutathione S-transferase
MASRIAAYDANLGVEFIQVDKKTNRTQSGEDFEQINPLDQVPVMRMTNGQLLFENSAILRVIANESPSYKNLSEYEKAKLQEWLSFVSTELHKGLFAILFNDSYSKDAKDHALQQAESRFQVLDKHLAKNEYLLSSFTAADAYLFTVLNWCQYVGIDLKTWPNVLSYFKKTAERPSVQRALSEEFQLYQKENQ